MAVSIGQSFQRLRPLLREAFAAAGPQVDTFTRGLTNAAENALPGLVHAIQAGGPVVQGLASFLEDVGSGFSEFFDVLAGHAPAAGTAFAELGRSLQALLPSLAELLGQGAELASVVLPILTSGLGGLNSVVNALGGSLPVLGGAFLAFRSVQGIGRSIGSLSARLTTASEAGGIFAGVQGKVGSALGTVSKAVPPLAVAVGLYGALAADSTQQTNDWAEALNQGGAASEVARIQMERQDAQVKDAQGGWKGLVLAITGNSAALGIYADDTEEARQKNDDFLASLTPLETANRNLDIATRALADGLGAEGTSASELAGLQSDVADATAEARRQQDLMAAATQGVTDAMAAQVDQALGLLDAQFGYEKAIRKTAEAENDYKDAVKEFGASSDKAKDALADFNDKLSTQVQLAAKVASSKLPASMTDNQKRILAAKGALDELNRVLATGTKIPPEMEEYRQTLLQITGQADGATLAQAQLSQAIGNLGFTVDSLPGTKTIEIKAPTDELKAKLDELDFTIVTLPNGDIRVEANTDKAMANLGNLTTLLNDVDTTTPEPTVSINDTAFMQTYKNLMRNLFDADRQRPEPVVSLDDNPFLSVWGPVMGNLRTVGSQRPRPTVSLLDLASGGISGIASRLAGLRDKTIRINTIQTLTYQTIGRPPGGMGGPQAATGGAIEDVLARAPRFDGGGSIYGRGGPTDDLNLIRASPGEHMLDARDVALMGGQQAVYAFREMLNSGKLGRPGSDTGIGNMLSRSAPRTAQTGSTLRDVTILTSDNPRAIVRAIRADEQQQAALAVSW
jgi:hypothetical protein